MEVRYCPELLANSSENPAFAKTRGTLTPRDVVLAVNRGLAEGMRKYRVTVKTILCIMTHIPGTCVTPLSDMVLLSDTGLIELFTIAVYT